jgi:hypothetical protein
LLALVIPLAAAAGLWTTLGRGWIGARQGGAGQSLPKAAHQDRLLEETLRPFYIPLPSDSKTRVVMIVSAAVWDGVASVRYRKMESRVRERLYGYIADLAARKSLPDMSSRLESGMGSILREVLGLAELEVKIKEIKAF